ncbi:MAG: VTT domain-containing protein [Planctomycetota bacterium]
MSTPTRGIAVLPSHAVKSLLKVAIPLGLFFGAMLVLLRLTGVLDDERIRAMLEAAQAASPIWGAAAVAGLMLGDLFFPVPTLSVMLVAGSLLGFTVSATASIFGLLLAGSCGYVLSARYGHVIVKRIVPDEVEREDMNRIFLRHGVIVILLSRALPMLPEVSACLAGATGMRWRTFLLAWLASTVPYALVASYAGSISSLDNPWPAILTAVGLGSVFATGWLLFRRSLAIKVER